MEEDGGIVGVGGKGPLEIPVAFLQFTQRQIFVLIESLTEVDEVSRCGLS